MVEGVLKVWGSRFSSLRSRASGFGLFRFWGLRAESFGAQGLGW